MTKKQIAEHEIIVHGIWHEQYFQGCGLAFSTFTDVATGIGETTMEALEDALECLSQHEEDWNLESIKASETDLDQWEIDRSDQGENEENENHVYVSIRVR